MKWLATDSWKASNSLPAFGIFDGFGSNLEEKIEIYFDTKIKNYPDKTPFSATGSSGAWAQGCRKGER